jgi:hypothetical protein
MFRFQLVKTTWGIFVDIDGTIEFEGPTPDQTPIADGIYLVQSGKMLLHEELEQARRAVLRHKDTLDARRGGGPAVVTLTSFTFAATDFQLEGIDAAITSWLAQELSSQNPWLGGSYNRERNRYDFEYSDGVVRGIPHQHDRSSAAEHSRNFANGTDRRELFFIFLLALFLLKMLWAFDLAGKR